MSDPDACTASAADRESGSLQTRHFGTRLSGLWARGCNCDVVHGLKGWSQPRATPSLGIALEPAPTHRCDPAASSPPVVASAPAPLEAARDYPLAGSCTGGLPRARRAEPLRASRLFLPPRPAPTALGSRARVRHRCGGARPRDRVVGRRDAQRCRMGGCRAVRRVRVVTLRWPRRSRTTKRGSNDRPAALPGFVVNIGYLAWASAVAMTG